MKKSKLPKSLTTVTTLSKTIALALFIALPFIGFYYGVNYQQAVQVSNIPVPTIYQLQPTPTQIPEETGTQIQMCGGFAGISCPTGLKCKLDGNYPDAAGKCIKE